MKTLFIFLSLFFLFAACSSTEKTANSEQFALISAAYYNWTASIPDGSGGMERGTDIILTLAGWPDDYTPGPVIFRNKQSFSAAIEEEEEVYVILRASIIHESAVLMGVSERSDLSDRFIFEKPDGETVHIEISDWEKLPDRYQ